MSRIWAVLLLAGLAAGCGATSKIAQTPATTTLAGALGDHPASPQASNPVIAQQAISTAQEPAASPAPKGQCDAPSLAYLIGRSRMEIPVPADLSHRRVACTTCPADGAYQSTRTNILFNANTGIITAVTCG